MSGIALYEMSPPAHLAMPVCRKCRATFPNKIVIEGKNRTLNSRVHCLVCSPWRIRTPQFALHAAPAAGRQAQPATASDAPVPIRERLELTAKKRNTCDIGDITEAFVRAMLLQAGYAVITSDRASSAYDHIIEQPGKFLRLQTKTGRYRDGSVIFNAPPYRARKTPRLARAACTQPLKWKYSLFFVKS